MDFDTWFAAQGYDEQHRAMFRVVWDAAQENAGEEGSIYLSPEERREAQRALSALHRERLDSVALATKPYTCPDGWPL